MAFMDDLRSAYTACRAQALDVGGILTELREELVAVTDKSRTAVRAPQRPNRSSLPPEEKSNKC
jgi:hypothetical protein